MKGELREQGFSLLELLVALSLLGGILIILSDIVPILGPRITQTRNTNSIISQQLITYTAIRNIGYHAISLRFTANFRGAKRSLKVVSKAAQTKGRHVGVRIKKDQNGIFSIILNENGHHRPIFDNLKIAYFQYLATKPTVWHDEWDEADFPLGIRLFYQPLDSKRQIQTMVWKTGSN